jgi:hypothetical protein
MENCYYTKLKFLNRDFKIYILTKEKNQFDLQVEVKGSLAGDDFILLRKYLLDEGYVEAAKEYNKHLIK